MIARKLVDNSLKNNYQLDTKCKIKIFYEKWFNFSQKKKMNYFSLDFYLARQISETEE